MPDAPPPTDLAAILAELDRRLRELEEELAAVGAPRPSGAPEPEAATPAPPPPGPAAPAEPGPPSAEDPDAALASIRAAVPNRVEVVARAPDALVLRVELDAGREGEESGR